MATYIDQRLTEKINRAGETGPIEAVIVVKENEEISLAMDDGGLTRCVIDGAVERTGELPHTIRYFPRANAAIISASVKLIQEIIKDENLAVASATDVDAIVFY
jgi:hypothetical protein